MYFYTIYRAEIGFLFASVSFLRYNNPKRIRGTRHESLNLHRIRRVRPLIHRFKPEDIEEAYRVFEKRKDGVIKIAVMT